MNTEKIDSDNMVIEIYSPKWQYAARIVFPLFVILYFLSIPVDCILFSKLFNYHVYLFAGFIFLHILLKKKVLQPDLGIFTLFLHIFLDIKLTFYQL